MVDQWHADAEIGLNAYTTAPLWLCLQLPRFYYRSPGWAIKQSHPYLLSQCLKIPIFVTADNLVVQWMSYTVLACIQHHGPRPNEGHYTAVLRSRTQQWLFDDEKPPHLLNNHQLDHLSSNMYLVFVVKSYPAQNHVASDPAVPSTHAAGGQERHVPAMLESGRSQLARESSQPAASAARGHVGASHHSAAGRLTTDDGSGDPEGSIPVAVTSGSE